MKTFQSSFEKSLWEKICYGSISIEHGSICEDSSGNIPTNHVWRDVLYSIIKENEVKIEKSCINIPNIPWVCFYTSQ